MNSPQFITERDATTFKKRKVVRWWDGEHWHELDLEFVNRQVTTVEELPHV